MSRRRLLHPALVAVAVAGALTLVGCTSSSSHPKSTPSAGASVPAATGPSGGPTNAPALQEALVKVVDTVLPSVVQIRTSSGLGSGVVFDNNGHIVTNAHVVGSATSFEVRFANSAQVVKGTLVGTYPPDDLAVIKVDPSHVKLHPATFGDSSKLRVGDIVLAMGNPLGLSASVTNGIISAVGRTVTEPKGQDSPGATLPDVIQTSAAINPGNSGGALVDLNGQVVGIPTLAAVDPELGGSAAPGIGFAVSSNVVKNIASQLVEHGKVINSHRAEIGIYPTTVIDDQGNPAGVGIVKLVPGGPAEKAGMQAGEIITSVDGTKTPTAESLSVVLAQLQPGQTVTVTVVGTDGKTSDVKVTLGELNG